MKNNIGLFLALVLGLVLVADYIDDRSLAETTKSAIAATYLSGWADGCAATTDKVIHSLDIDLTEMFRKDSIIYMNKYFK